MPAIIATPSEFGALFVVLADLYAEYTLTLTFSQRERGFWDTLPGLVPQRPERHAPSRRGLVAP